MTLFDERMVRQTAERPNLMVSWYLMAALAYEVQDRPILSDAAWDDLCRRMDARWDEIDHPHKRFVDRATLSSATASYINYDALPQIVTGAVRSLRKGD